MMDIIGGVLMIVAFIVLMTIFIKIDEWGEDKGYWGYQSRVDKFYKDKQKNKK